MFIVCTFTTHTVELYKLFSFNAVFPTGNNRSVWFDLIFFFDPLTCLIIFCNYFTAAFIVSGKHATKHYKIGACCKSLCNIARSSTSAISDNVTTETVCRIGAFDNR